MMSQNKSCFRCSRLDSRWSCYGIMTTSSTNYLFSLLRLKNLFQIYFKSLNDLARSLQPKIIKNVRKHLKRKRDWNFARWILAELRIEKPCWLRRIPSGCKKQIAVGEACFRRFIWFISRRLHFNALEKRIIWSDTSNKIKELPVDQTSGISLIRIKGTGCSSAPFYNGPATARSS